MKKPPNGDGAAAASSSGDECQALDTGLDRMKRGLERAPSVSYRTKIPRRSNETTKTRKSKEKRVRFASAEPQVFFFEAYDQPEANVDPSELVPSTQLSSQLTLLSSTHGRARRELRDISKQTLHACRKYGEKTPARTVNGQRRWRLEFGNTVFITDVTCTKEITSYKLAVSIEPATITPKMRDEHNEVSRTLRDNFRLCTTHSIIIVDQSGSMRTCDVNGFRTRSEAAYGTLALDYIAEQLYQRIGDETFIDAVTVIEMNDEGSILFDREPLDWILFNKLLARQKEAAPRSHGNYVSSLQLAQSLIQKDLEQLSDLDNDDMPAYMLVLLSDGRPSDKLPQDCSNRQEIIESLSISLGDKLTLFGMGIGPVGSEFDSMSDLVHTAKICGANEDSQFTHAGLSSAKIGDAFSSLASSATSTRTELLTKSEDEKPDKDFTMRDKISDSGIWPSRRFTSQVTRYHYDPNLEYPWRKGGFRNATASGFDIEDNPFGKGAERLAYRFHEVGHDDGELKRVGGVMVAKESKKIQNDDETRKESFHYHFCRVQYTASDLAHEFNKVVKRTPSLFPIEDEVGRPPTITFLRCYVYEYMKDRVRCGLLVENYLKGKYIKYNGNNGYVCKAVSGPTIELQVGEVKFTDFLHAFSHWVYVHTNHKILVCDLQGVLNEEGRYPRFQLTDPAINSENRRKNKFGKTDCGMKGIRLFSRTHKCNGVCKGLGLPPI